MMVPIMVSLQEGCIPCIVERMEPIVVPWMDSLSLRSSDEMIPGISGDLIPRYHYWHLGDGIP